MNAVEPILKAIREGYGALLVTGRSQFDFSLDGEAMCPLIEILRRALFREFGMVTLTFSFATGVDWPERSIAHESDRQAIRQFLTNRGVLNIRPDEDELVNTVRGFASLVRSSPDNPTWQDGRPIRFAVYFQFADNIAPCSSMGGQSDNQVVVNELVHVLAQSIRLRDSGNVLLFVGDEEAMNSLVVKALKRVSLPQPSQEESRAFIATAIDFYRPRLEAGLTPESIAKLVTNAGNRGIEGQLRASSRTGQVLTAREIAQQKDRDIERLSEGTLTPLDTARVANVKLVGRNTLKVQEIVTELGRRLRAGDTHTPMNALMAGGPGGGKTDMALIAAREAGCPAYQLENPKDGIVGATERRVGLQMRMMQEWSPLVGFIDELTEAIPVQRGGHNGDNGASAAIVAKYLTCLSDVRRKGRSLLIATTNRPEAMGSAMRSRFTTIPVLMPLVEDLPEIIVAIAERLSPGFGLSTADPLIMDAARIFAAKGATPRHIDSALGSSLLTLRTETIEPHVVLFAAQDLCSTTDFESSVYADLLAIKYCALRSYLPWNDSQLTDYPFPPYLDAIVDKASGDVIQTVLDRKIEELRPRANV